MLKLCSLFIIPSESQQFYHLNEFLFVPFTNSDENLCDFFQIDISIINEYIENDTVLCKYNARHDIPCIFIFRYVSMLYQYFWNDESLQNISNLVMRKKDILYYIIILFKKFTYKIAHLHLFILDIPSRNEVKKAFTNIISMNPIEIYLTKYKSRKSEIYCKSIRGFFVD